MAEIKRTFAKAKMNKDIDERILPPGEYIDAWNVQAKGSDGSDSGSLQNIMGNTLLNTVVNSGTYDIPTDSTCVGAVADTTVDQIYYLVSCREELPDTPGTNVAINKDCVMSVDSDGILRYIFVDIYDVEFNMPAVSSANTFSTAAFTGLNNALRAGMTFGVSNANGEPVTIVSVVGNDVTLSDTISVTEEVRRFRAKRVLELPTSGLITGINVLEGSLYWTDNEHEPKKINLTRSRKGTGANTRTSMSLSAGAHPNFHTRLVVDSLDNPGQQTIVLNDAGNEPIWVKWDNVTVLKPSPKRALKIEMSATAVRRETNVGVELNTFGVIPNKKIHTGLYGPEADAYITDVVFESPVAFRVGDVVNFNVVNGGPGGEEAVTAVVYESPYTSTNAAEGTTGVKFQVLTISPDLIDVFYDWTVTLREEKPVFDTKIARFSYRWKYTDGEYSTFAPWSKPAFMPSEYGYYAQNGYNTGMESRVSSLVLENYASEDIPVDVHEIELLYKTTNNPTVYTIDAFSKKDKFQGWDEDPTSYWHQGSYKVTTDLIHAVVPSNQLLRPYDNVPRKALAQEVSANRLIYGNYLHNYDVFENPKGSVNLSAESPVNNIGVPSIKSLRDYQLGLVWHDTLGRETPVLPLCEVRVDQDRSHLGNYFTAKLTGSTYRPPWATHFSYYIKEPSVEYYNLGMDRWYNAADNNIWISFPSSERNKITEETFLYLKKGHGNNLSVPRSPEYKILAIENEAPDYIKTKYKSVGDVTNNAAADPAENLIGTSEGGYPLIGMRAISIDAGAIEALEIENMHSTPYRLRFWEWGNYDNVKSRFYDVDKVTLSGGMYHFHLAVPIGNDCAFATQEGQDNTYANRIDELNCRLYEGSVKNAPEYDGRFFVKIKRDPIIEHYVVGMGEVDDWLVYDTIPFCLLDNKYMARDGSELPFKSIKTEVGLTLDNLHPTETLYTVGGTPETAYAWGSSSQFIDSDQFDITNSPISTINGTESKPFWEWMRGRKTFFIDACSAYSWQGRELPGSYYDDANNFTAAGEVWDSDPHATAYAKASDYSGFNDQGGGVVNMFIDKYSNGGPAWFTWTDWGGDSFVSYNEQLGPWTDADGNTMQCSRAESAKGMWNDGSYGYMDISWTGFDVDWDYSAGEPRSNLTNNGYFSDGYGCIQHDGHDYYGTSEMMHHRSMIEKLMIFGQKFRFRNDPDQTVYEMELLPRQYYGSTASQSWAPNSISTTIQDNWSEFNGMYAKIPSNYMNTTEQLPDSITKLGVYGIRNYASHVNSDTWEADQDSGYQEQFAGTNLRQKWTFKVSPNFGSGPHGYMPTTGTQIDPNDHPGSERVRALHHDGTNYDYIELLEPAVVDDEGNDMSSGFVTNPAVFETKPRESVDVDIYYQASDILPVTIDTDKCSPYDLVPRNSTFSKNNYTYLVRKWDRHTIHISTTNPNYSTSLQTNIDEIIGIKTPNGRISNIHLVGTSGGTTVRVKFPNDILTTEHRLCWNNCWAFGNGVESDRIRDDYNAKQMDNGVKASTVLAGPVKSERRKHGVIWSGIYNSNSGINDTNQFIMAEAITKDLNPVHGSIQRLLNRDTRLVAFCENKVLRADTNKDSLYNADGSRNVVASDTVVGDFTPYAGKHGISKNPESLAVSASSSYFTDAVRGQVLALYSNGIHVISAAGMESYFNDLEAQTTLLGSFDEDTMEYNLTVSGHTKAPYTASYGENTKSWISFKSFLPECGISMNNKYYTFVNGQVWHHHSNDTYGSFYGATYDASVTTNFGGSDGGVKSFNTINYEGSQAAVLASVSHTVDTLTGDYSINNGVASATVYDGEYFNLTAKNGWYAEYMNTNLQSGGSIYFKNKEGKYFGAPKGVENSVVNTSNISVQGIGYAIISHGSPSDSGEITVTANISSTSPTGDNWD